MTYALLALDPLTNKFELLIGVFRSMVETAAFISKTYNVRVHVSSLSKLLHNQPVTAWLKTFFSLVYFKDIYQYFDSHRGRATRVPELVTVDAVTVDEPQETPSS